MTNTQAALLSIVSASKLEKSVTIKAKNGTETTLKRAGVRKSDIAVTNYAEFPQAVGTLTVGQRLHFAGVPTKSPRKQPNRASVVNYLTSAGYTVARDENGYVASVGANQFRIVSVNTAQAARAGRASFERYIERVA